MIDALVTDIRIFTLTPRTYLFRTFLSIVLLKIINKVLGRFVIRILNPQPMEYKTTSSSFPRIMRTKTPCIVSSMSPISRQWRRYPSPVEIYPFDSVRLRLRSQKPTKRCRSDVTKSSRNLTVP